MLLEKKKIIARIRCFQLASVIFIFGNTYMCTENRTYLQTAPLLKRRDRRRVAHLLVANRVAYTFGLRLIREGSCVKEIIEII
jgi:hypothetical protein